MLAQEKALGLSPPFFFSRALELPREGRDILSTVGAPALLLTLGKKFFSYLVHLGDAPSAYCGLHCRGVTG
jgi:hypothetical protein